jgi:drug/metabolite transporter (DMT)-like permease
VQGGKQTYQAGVIFVLLATVGWSLSGIFVRFMPGLDGWQINCWRGLWTGIALFLYLVIVYRGDVFERFKAVPTGALLFSALFFSVGSTMYVASLALISTAVVSVIGATAPLVAALLSPWVTKEKPGPEAWIAAMLALAGIVVIAWDGISSGLGIGLLFAMIIPLTFAGQTLALRRYRDVDMVPAICVGGFASFVLAGMLGFAAGHAGGGFVIPLRDLGLLALMALLQLALPLIFYTYGARSVPAVTLTLLSMLDALLNPLWTWLIVNEKPQPSAVIGGGIIILAVLLAVFGARMFRQQGAAVPESALPPDLH